MFTWFTKEYSCSLLCGINWLSPTTIKVKRREGVNVKMSQNNRFFRDENRGGGRQARQKATVEYLFQKNSNQRFLSIIPALPTIFLHNSKQNINKVNETNRVLELHDKKFEFMRWSSKTRFNCTQIMIMMIMMWARTPVNWYNSFHGAQKLNIDAKIHLKFGKPGGGR